MHERLKALKPLLKAGDYDKAEEALTAYREEFPDDWDGRLMEGIVAQLKGDEATFRRIHDEAQAVIDRHGKDGAQIQTSPLWKKYHSSWKKIATVAVIGILVAGAGGALMMLNKDVVNRIQWVLDVLRYGKKNLYDGPPYFDKRILPSDETAPDVPVDLD